MLWVYGRYKYLKLRPHQTPRRAAPRCAAPKKSVGAAPPRRVKKDKLYTVYRSSGYTESREMKAGESLSLTAPRFLTRGAAFGGAAPLVF